MAPNKFTSRSFVVPAKPSTMAICSEKKQPSWFLGSKIPADLSVQVQETTFNVHKYPLVLRCGYFGRLELQPSISNFGYDVNLDNFPGGSETFEIILKFCYGLPIDLNPNNIASVRCASEFLEMTEELEDGNLISRTEAFLTFVILSSWRDSIIVLKSCENLSPWAENLQIVRRCCDSITRNAPTTGEIADQDWWFDNLTTLRIDHFMRIISAVKAKGLKPEIIGSCIMYYAQKWLPGYDIELERVRGLKSCKTELQMSILSGKSEEEGMGPNKEHKQIIESLVSILPLQKEAVPCKFLWWLLKMAMVYSATPALVSELEKRAGMVLEDANVNDLLIPSLRNGDQGKVTDSPVESSIHDIAMVQRTIEYFLMHDQQHQQQKSGKSNISKLLDSYLAEVSGDPGLSISKFQVLAETLPQNARTCHDGLYRAIDTYLKTHPSLSEHDRRRLCKIVDSEKLSLDACRHAAQNDRLPLRTVMQVLFAEQVKLRSVIQGNNSVLAVDNSDHGENHTSTNTEIKSLKAELESIKAQMSELQKDHANLQQEYEMLFNKQRKSWTLGLKNIINSALFHGKTTNGYDTGEQQRSQLSRRFSLRRRFSMS